MIVRQDQFITYITQIYPVAQTEIVYTNALTGSDCAFETSVSGAANTGSFTQFEPPVVNHDMIMGSASYEQFTDEDIIWREIQEVKVLLSASAGVGGEAEPIDLVQLDTDYSASLGL